MEKKETIISEYIQGELWQFPKFIQVKRDKKLQDRAKQYNEVLDNLEDLYGQSVDEIKNNFKDEVYRLGEKRGR